MFFLKKNIEIIYYRDIWKRSNIISTHKKNGKQLVNNYRPISLYFEKYLKKSCSIKFTTFY